MFCMTSGCWQCKSTTFIFPVNNIGNNQRYKEGNLIFSGREQINIGLLAFGWKNKACRRRAGHWLGNGGTDKNPNYESEGSQERRGGGEWEEEEFNS